MPDRIDIDRPDDDDERDVNVNGVTLEIYDRTEHGQVDEQERQERRERRRK